MDTLAARLRFARERAGLSQSELARRVGVTAQSIQSVESGRVKRTKAIAEIAAALSVGREWLDPHGPARPIALSEPHVPNGHHVLAEATFADALTISIRANRPFDDTVRSRLKALLELNGLIDR